MGCVNNFVSPDKLLNSGELEECDIIEFNRLSFSHFAFYIGDGICVNVTGPTAGPSSSSKKYPKGMKEAQELAVIAGYDYRYNKVRVNNCVLAATSLGVAKRPTKEAIDYALSGLNRDYNGKVILEDPIDYDYNLAANNCEYFATRCRYTGNGFSMQVANPTMSLTLGTFERATSAVRHDLADIIMDENRNLATRGTAVVGYAANTAVGWTAYGAKTATDAVVAGTFGVCRAVDSVLKLFK